MSFCLLVWLALLADLLQEGRKLIHPVKTGIVFGGERREEGSEKCGFWKVRNVFSGCEGLMCLSNVKSSVLFLILFWGGGLSSLAKPVQLSKIIHVHRLMYNEHDTGNMVAERRTYIHFYT